MDGLNLIRDLLEVSAFSNYDQQPEITTVSLREQLSSKRDEFKAEAESKHIGIAVNLEKDVMLASDPSYLSRILDNLISNAIKFSNPESEVILSGGKKNGKPYLSVKDFGPGFSEEDREKLYNKFSRLSAQPTAGESSNGLGLAIVKILVDNLNAEIDLISEKGKGSEFIISFTDQQEIFQDSR
jgi:signal transduction histidine kinase